VLRSTFFMAVPCGRCGKRPKHCACKDGYTPDVAKQTEEENIYYVACTRAKAQLTFCMERF
jgi:ATP-dependent exoDNAse (exonuclease V) beta subunit